MMDRRELLYRASMLLGGAITASAASGILAGCTTTRLNEMTISADAPLTFHLDGEPVVGGTTLRARVHPSALRVAVAGN